MPPSAKAEVRSDVLTVEYELVRVGKHSRVAICSGVGHRYRLSRMDDLAMHLNIL